MTETETARLDAKLEALDDKIDVMSSRIARIEALLETEAARCPFRESIATAAAIEPRVIKLEDRLVQLEIRVAAIGGVAGIVTSVITALLINVVK